jgi:hypothetical protein
MYLHRQEENVQNKGRKLVDRMRGRATVRLTTDEIMALTRGEADAWPGAADSNIVLDLVEPAPQSPLGRFLLRPRHQR